MICHITQDALDFEMRGAFGFGMHTPHPYQVLRKYPFLFYGSMAPLISLPDTLALCLSLFTIQVLSMRRLLSVPNPNRILNLHFVISRVPLYFDLSHVQPLFTVPFVMYSFAFNICNFILDDSHIIYAYLCSLISQHRSVPLGTRMLKPMGDLITLPF